MPLGSAVLRHLPPPTASGLRSARRWLDLQTELRGSRQRAIRASIAVPGLPRRRVRVRPGSVWAVSLVRNEEDVIEGVVQHMLDQGVDGIIVVDNMSSDGTPGILRRMSKSDSRLFVGQDSMTAFHQGQKVSHLAHLAWRMGADWIVPFDADEQWFAPTGKLGPFLAEQPVEVQALWADYRAVWPPTEGFAWGAQGAWTVDVEVDARKKIAFRSRRWVFVGEGNHALRWGYGIPETRLHMLHYSVRSLGQLTRKARSGTEGLAAAGMDAGVGTHWRGWDGASADEREQLWSLYVDRAGTVVGEAKRVHVTEPTHWDVWDPHGEIAAVEVVPSDAGSLT